MNPLNDHELPLWAMRAGLTRDEVRQTVQRGLKEGAIRRQTFNETSPQQQERFQTVRDYLQDQYLAGCSEYLENIRGMNAHLKSWMQRPSDIHYITPSTSS
jgi:hypothetical protein